MVDFLDPVTQNLMTDHNQNFRIGGRIYGHVALIELFWFLIGTLSWQPIKFEKKSTFFLDQSTLSRSHLETDCNVALPNVKGFNGMNFSTLCTIILTFGPATPTAYDMLTIALLWQYGKNRHITPIISECPGPILIYFTGLVVVLVGIINHIFVWRCPRDNDIATS